MGNFTGAAAFQHGWTNMGTLKEIWGSPAERALSVTKELAAGQEGSANFGMRVPLTAPVASILRTRDTTTVLLEEESWNATLPTGKPAIFTSKSVEPQADITVGVT